VSDKTEDPTPRRLRRARAEGDSGASSHAAQAVAFVLAVAIVPSAVRALASEASSELHGAIERAGRVRAIGGAVLARAFDAQTFATSVLSVVLPALVTVGVAGGLAHAVQTGGVMASGRLTPKLDRLDPIAGAKALLSGPRLFAVGRAFVAALLVGWLACRDLSDRVLDVARVAGRPAWAGVVVADVAGRFAWHAAAVGLGLGLLDFVVARRVWLGRLRMTREEVRREHKDSEGDPAVRAARHRAYQELLAQAAIANVRTATVVVVNPTHLACALRYDEKGGDEAPVVVASGEGDLAARIAQAAQEWGVPIVRDVPLARALVELSVGEAIPEALYEVVAEILRELWEAEPERHSR
jgi:flagellar biosynthesis protein FlhB